MKAPTLSVILPANNEAAVIGTCLAALFASDPRPEGAEVVVVANGCSDATAAVAAGHAAQAGAAGWRLVVIDRPEGGKPGALNAGDAAATGAIRVYLDADVAVSPPLMAQIAAALARPGPAYASGRPEITPARSRFSRAYGRFWSRLPFFRTPAPGFGLFAVNAAGRARWGAFPAIISDDTYVRLLFRPGERIELPAPYRWPLAEGFARLTRTRRRQDAGVAEIARDFPHLMANEAKPRLPPARLAALALRDPSGFAAYAAVSLAVRLRPQGADWTRGR